MTDQFERVSWNDIQVFLTRLNDMEQIAGRFTRRLEICSAHGGSMGICLPGRRPRRTRGAMISIPPVPIITGMVVQLLELILGKPVMLGMYNPNPWGFFDMHGNVWELVYDWHAAYAVGSKTNPEGPASGLNVVMRGGSWHYTPSRIRSAKRYIRQIKLVVRVTLASVSLSKPCQPIRRIPNWNCSGEPPSRARRAKPGRSPASRPTMHGTEISPIRSWSRDRWI